MINKKQFFSFYGGKLGPFDRYARKNGVLKLSNLSKTISPLAFNVGQNSADLPSYLDRHRFMLELFVVKF